MSVGPSVAHNQDKHDGEMAMGDKSNQWSHYLLWPIYGYLRPLTRKAFPHETVLTRDLH